MEKIGKDISQALYQRSQAWKKEQALHAERGLSKVSILRNWEACPVCSKDFTNYHTVRGIQYCICLGCRHLFSRQVFSDPIVFYQELSGQAEVYSNLQIATLLLRSSEILEPKLNFILDLVPVPIDQNPIWVDVGCGSGEFLSLVKKSGFLAVGFEIDEQFIGLVRKREIDCYKILLDKDTEFPEILGRAKIVSLFNIVEHIESPVDTLKNLVQNLSPETLVIIEVPRHPSVSSIMNTIEGNLIYRHINPPEHLHIFSDESMSHLVRDLGLKILATWKYGSDAIEVFDYAIRSLVVEDAINYEEQSKKIAISNLQLAIDRAGLSDVMLVIAKKLD